MRQRAQRGKRPQYQKDESSPLVSGWAVESGLIYFVELSRKIDTGLFLDTRPLRKLVRDLAAGKRVLNLFCYTGGFSVCAAAGGASYVESVDLSSTALNMARLNLAANGFTDPRRYKITRSDAVRYLEGKMRSAGPPALFDIIILDPPTFSNSKDASDLDIRRDWPRLVSLCLALLSVGGVLFFSTNARRFRMDASLVEGAAIEDISLKTIPPDFRDKRIRKTWKITKSKET